MPSLEDALVMHATYALAPFIDADPLFPITPKILDALEGCFMAHVVLRLPEITTSDAALLQRLRRQRDTQAFEAKVRALLPDADRLFEELALAAV